MLKQLSISNYKLIDHIECEFGPGLTVLTGETGAGKSIIIGALRTLLEGLSESDIFLAEERPVTISAIFSAPQNPAFHQRLAASGLGEQPEEIILRRQIGRRRDGGLTNRIYLNDQPTTGATASDLAGRLLEFVDQHQQHELRAASQPLKLLDSFGGLTSQRREYKLLFEDFRRQRQAFTQWQQELQEAARQMDYLSHQLTELNASQLDPEEETELLHRRRQYQQIGRLQELAREADQLCYSGQGSILDRCYRLQEISDELSRRDEQAPVTRELLTDIIDRLQEINRDQQKYLAGLEIDEETIEKTETRLAQLERLKRKFATDIQGLLALEKELTEKLSRWEQRDQESGRRQRELAAKQGKMEAAAEALSQTRSAQAKLLEETVSGHLRDLNLAQARFQISLEKTTCSATGADQVNFLFSANPGSAPAPLGEIASGGELSRLLLALRTAAAARAELPTMIFDEIDTGLGGAAAGAVGRKIAAIARNCQVITITHLPQVAAHADQHYVINKQSCPEEEKTTIMLNEISLASETAVIEELARMGSSGKITREALDHARALRAEAGKGGRK
ncbi:MAG TPA: DNA repair protein RecN [Proteobacteria bacterium]|nr:DNA repair protein RecN [Pseudomonadota bacterium]